MDKKINAILIHNNDNVITAIESLQTGSVAKYQADQEIVEIVITEDIPKFHKIAVVDIRESEPV